MKKLFSILLTLAMLLNVGIVAMAADGEATTTATPEELIPWGGFEDESYTPVYFSASDIETYPTVDGRIKSITNTGVSTSAKNASETNSNGTYCIINGILTDETTGNKYLSVKQSNYLGLPLGSFSLAGGSVYKISGKFKLAPKSDGETHEANIGFYQSTNNKYSRAIMDGADGEPTYLRNMRQCASTSTPDAIRSAGVKTVTDLEWTTVEAYFYVSGTSNRTATIRPMVSSGKTFYIDDLSLTKVGTNGIIDGEDEISIPSAGAEDNTQEYEYTGFEKLASASEITIDGEYPGVKIENGILKVTSAAAPGTVTLKIIKTYQEEYANKQWSTTTMSLASKEVVILPPNLITDGGFETENAWQVHTEEQAFEKRVESIDATTEDAFSGEKSLEIVNTRQYYPATFKVNVEKGGIYKFTAYAKLTSENTAPAGVALGVYRAPGEDMTDNGIYVLKDGTFDDTLINAGQSWRTTNPTNLSTSDWIPFERYFYVSNKATSQSTIPVYIGMKSTSSTQNIYFNYYIDDVSLIKVGDANLTVDASYVDIPAEGSVDVNYSFESDVAADTVTIALAPENAGVTYENGVITVTSEATPGVITLQVKGDASAGDDVIAKHDIVLFDEAGQIYEKTADSATGAVTYNVYVKESVQASATLIRATYGSAFESVVSYDSTDMGDFWKIEKSFELGNGTYKFMLWDGIGTMRPIADAYNVVVNIPAE